ncbi:MAG: carboxypeptidase-like regulatory domain-containing protein [Candidatus Acidiferrales bacterium]
MKPRTSRIRFTLPAALVICCALLGVPAHAQSSQLRTVHGQVVDKNDSPAPTSVVYLLNAKTQAVRTYFADDKGEYHFSGLDPNVDYEVHAEHGNMTSSAHKISSYDSRRDIDLTLKLAREK